MEQTLAIGQSSTAVMEVPIMIFPSGFQVCVATCTLTDTDTEGQVSDLTCDMCVGTP